MREIKFRGWNGVEMLKPQDLSQSGKFWQWLGNVDAVLMQYIGRKDKNGVEIYEGDILKAHGEVVWNQDEFRWSCIDLTWNDKREWHDLDYLTSALEVIGNIYEEVK